MKNIYTLCVLSLLFLLGMACQITSSGQNAATEIALQRDTKPSVSPRGPGEGGGGGFPCKRVVHVCVFARHNDSTVSVDPDHREVNRGDCVWWHARSLDDSAAPGISSIHFIDPSEGNHDGKNPNAIPITDVCNGGPNLHDCLVYIDLPQCTTDECKYRYMVNLTHEGMNKHSDPELEVSGTCCIIFRPGNPSCPPPASSPPR